MKILPTADDVFQFAAKDFMHRVIAGVYQKGLFSVVLSGGHTPSAFFDKLVSVEYYRNSIPWHAIQFFFGDERYVPSDSTDSNYHMAYEHLFSKVPIEPNNIYRIPTEISPPEEAALSYEQTLKDLPPFDLLYLGLGDNGHTASLMPFCKLSFPPEQLVASLFVPDLNMTRITLTPHAINQAKDIIFLVTGENKAHAVAEVIEGKRNTNRYPAQLIQSIHGKTLWYLDQAAAHQLGHQAHDDESHFS